MWKVFEDFRRGQGRYVPLCQTKPGRQCHSSRCTARCWPESRRRRTESRARRRCGSRCHRHSRSTRRCANLALLRRASPARDRSWSSINLCSPATTKAPGRLPAPAIVVCRAPTTSCESAGVCAARESAGRYFGNARRQNAPVRYASQARDNCRMFGRCR